MNRFLTDTPRPVLISLAVMLATVILFAVLLPVLGGARDQSFADNVRLKREIESARRSIKQSEEDKAYVEENAAAFEALQKSDRLVPHTRRAAIVRLESAARENGLTGFSYSIGSVSGASAKAVGVQPASDAYQVSVEGIQLKVGAPIDGSIYRFLADISDSFPGAAVIETFSLKRQDIISADALAAVSQGMDSKLVEGEIALSWRTAQRKDGEDKKK
jgi:hypothetical protein